VKIIHTVPPKPQFFLPFAAVSTIATFISTQIKLYLSTEWTPVEYLSFKQQNQVKTDLR